MLTIIYPKEDYTSADIAIRVQALAQGQGQKIYVVPKHYGRNEENVFAKLSKATSILFIAHDKLNIDQNTEKELSFLSSKGKKVHYIVPTDMNLTTDSTYIHKYLNNNKMDFANAIQGFIQKIQTNEQGSKKINKENAVLLAVSMLIVTIIFLLIISNLNNNEKD